MQSLKSLIITLSFLFLFIGLEYQFGFMTGLVFMAGPINMYICLAIGCVHLYGVIKSFWSSKGLDRLSFINTSLGLLGTFLGLIIMFNTSFISVSLDNSEAVKQLMASIMAGLGLAFNTTIMGVMSSIWLSVYGVFNEDV